MIRPKSAVYVNMPYSFSSKQEALEAKRRVKENLLLSPELDLSKRSITSIPTRDMSSSASYLDHGPSLLHDVRSSYGVRSSRNMKTPEKKLKPCQRLNRRSLQHMKKCLRDISDQTNFINNILQNSSNLQPMKHSSKKQASFRGQIRKISACATSLKTKENRFFTSNAGFNRRSSEREHLMPQGWTRNIFG